MPSWETPPSFEFLHQYLQGRAITVHTGRTSPYNTLLVCTLCLRHFFFSPPLHGSLSSKALLFTMPECKVLNSNTGPSHMVWISEFAALPLQPRRRIQRETFQLRQSWGCCCAGWTGLCLRCCSAAICRAWLGCSSLILLIPPGTQQSQSRLKASLDLRHMPKYADSHTVCSWPALVTGMLLTWHTRDFVFKKHQHTTQIWVLAKCSVLHFVGSECKDFLLVPQPTATVKTSCGAKNNCQLGPHRTNLRDSLPLKIKGGLCYLGKVESFCLH